MKTLITIITFITFFSTSFTQNALLPAYPREIIGEGVNGDIAYFKRDNKPFTGILVNEKTQKRIGVFKNGYKNGIFTEYHINGQKKSKCKYINGLRDGKCTEWFVNGQKKSSYTYANGAILNGNYITYLENGKKEKKEIYKGGQKISEGKYIEGQFYELSITYFSEGKSKKSEGYLKNGVKDGFWVVWYESGQIKNTGYFKGGMEDSLWTWWYSNGDKKKEAIYENGNLTTLIFENKVDPKFSIKTNLKPNAFLFRSLFNGGFTSINDKDTVYIMVSINYNNHYTNIKKFAHSIIEALSSRFELINKEDINHYGDKFLKYNIEFSELKLHFSRSSKMSFGGFKWGGKWKAEPSVKIKIKNLYSNLFYSIRTKNNVLSVKSEKEDKYADAITNALELINGKIINRFYTIFKVKTFIREILETDGDGYAETVSLELSNNLSIPEEMVFNIYYYGNSIYPKKIGQIELLKKINNKLVFEVNDGSEIITSKLRSGIKLVAISKIIN